MPAATWFTAKYLHRVREAAEATKLAELRLRGKA
jgi:hypothetical protein